MRISLRHTALFVLLLIIIAVVVLFVIEQKKPFAVLVYHDVSSMHMPADSLTIEADVLARELDYLKSRGYVSLPLAEATRLYNEDELPARAIVLTFDDASRQQVLLALPLLKARGMRATFFVPSEWIGDSGRLTQDDIRTLIAAGMEIGGHTREHAHLYGLSSQQLADEIASDKALLEEITGGEILTFAYPYGEYDTRIVASVREAGYVASRTSRPHETTSESGHALFGAHVLTNDFERFLAALHP